MKKQENPCDIHVVLMRGDSNHRTDTKRKSYDIYVTWVEWEILW